jgi:hypothetical protein
MRDDPRRSREQRQVLVAHYVVGRSAYHQTGLALTIRDFVCVQTVLERDCLVQMCIV